MLPFPSQGPETIYEKQNRAKAFVHPRLMFCTTIYTESRAIASTKKKDAAVRSVN